MKTRCPKCETRYTIDTDAIFYAGGLARCFHCGNVFDAIAEGSSEATPADDTEPAAPLRPDSPAEASAQVAALARAEDEATPLGLDRPAESSGQTEPAVAPEDDAMPPPFDIPDNLEPLQASPDAALDVVDTLYEKRSYRGIIYGWIAVLLLTALGLQLAWQNRETLLIRYPQLQPLCDRLHCTDTVVHAPDQLQIIQREIAPAPNQPGTLNLSARFRNDAQASQPLPDIQLSLIDNNGGVLIRRRLAPAEYIFPPPPEERLIAPGEVLTINIDFKDPGYLATGFMIDFL